MREQDLHRQVCDYLKLQYPGAMFRTDFAAGIKMTMGQAVRHKSLQFGRAWPDLMLAEARHGFCGLFLELKKPGGRGVLKDGSISPNDAHNQEQEVTLKALRERGYLAEFVVGFGAAKKMIDSYLSPRLR